MLHRLLVSMAALAVLGCGARIDVEDGASDTGEVTERAACDACRGDWGRHGLSQVESCNCRTEDSGRACGAATECEGQCLADAATELVTEEGPPRVGFLIGQCSEFRTSFGCHTWLSNGNGLGTPVLLDEVTTLRCLD